MFVAPLPSWQHRDSLVGDAVVKNFAQHIRLLAAPFMLARCRFVSGYWWILRSTSSREFSLVQVVTSSYTVQDRSIPGRSLFNCPAPCPMRTRKCMTFCSSGESPPAYSHSSKYALFKVSPVGVQNTCSRALLDAFPFLWDSKKSAGVAPLPP